MSNGMKFYGHDYNCHIDWNHMIIWLCKWCQDKDWMDIDKTCTIGNTSEVLGLISFSRSRVIFYKLKLCLLIIFYRSSFTYMCPYLHSYVPLIILTEFCPLVNILQRYVPWLYFTEFCPLVYIWQSCVPWLLFTELCPLAYILQSCVHWLLF